jgi:hypothetical protein
MKRSIIALAGVAALVAILALGYGFYHLSWFYKYWTLIGMVIITTIALAMKYNGVKNYLVRVVGELATNNNARWRALFILSVIFTISAILAGFGEPLLVSSSRRARQNLRESVGTNNIATAASLAGNLKRIFWGADTNLAPATITPAFTAPAATRKYPSWIHWKIAIFLWASTFIYAFFAFSDEVKNAWKKAVKTVERRKKLDNIRSRATTTQMPPALTSPATTTTPGAPITAKDLWKHLVKIEVLTEFIEVFIKLVGKRLFGA